MAMTRLADANAVGVANGKGRESPVGINLHIGKVKNGMPLDNFAPVFLARCQNNGDSAPTFHYVPVGDHQPVFADNESRTRAGTRDDVNHASQRFLGHVRCGIRRRGCRRRAASQVLPRLPAPPLSS